MIRGFTASAFDLLHAGHILMLQESKQHCDYLIAALHVNPQVERSYKNAPVQTLYERYIQLSGCRYVDSIIPYETEAELIQILCTQQIDIRFVGQEYANKDFTGKQFCIDNNIILHYTSRRHSYSSTELRNRLNHAA